MSMNAAAWTVLFALVAVAGCFEPYESGSDVPVECDEVHNQSALDDGVPNPIRCERTDVPETNGTNTT